MKKIILVLASSVAMSSVFANTVKIGVITTLTTSSAVVGKDVSRSVNLALEHLGGKVGNTNLEIIIEDDNFKPDTGRQKAEKLIKQEKVDFVTGFIWSHVLLASYKSVLDSGKFLISASAGPSQIAGKQCHKNFFAVAAQNDAPPMAMGELLNKQGIKNVYLMAPNFAAGTDILNGVQSTFKGRVAGKELTKWGADMQLDFSAELAKLRASKAEAVLVFYPGPTGPAFIKQFEQSGLNKTVKLYTYGTVDALSLPQLQDAKLTGILGSSTTQEWDPTLDNAANKRFVSDFKKKHGAYPSFYGALAYDAIMLIASAVKTVDGDMSNPDKVRAALKAANFDPVRGKFTIGTNHFPVQNYYLREVTTDSDGNWTTKVTDTIYRNHVDPYAVECKMK